uniref:MATE family efflux transporter n=2 Tax=Bursaphelenchus xylophilus TaxID=6326 RepID=A0A1I7SNX2_BURXY
MLRLALQEAQNASTTVDPITSAQMKQIFTFNLLPFIGFGILDNMLMILAGEYIEHSLGAVFTISTMAAAALGNMVSDVFGMGLAHYVELFVMRMGFKLPTLTTAQ